MIKTILLTLLSISSLANQTYLCDDSDCHNPNQTYEFSDTNNEYYLRIEENDDNLTINSDFLSKEVQLNLNLNNDLENNSPFNVTIDLTSSVLNLNSSSMVAKSDILSSFNFTSNGRDGEDAKNASVLCAESVINGDYGNDIKNFFENRRLLDSNLSNSCDQVDIDYIQSTFSCPIGTIEGNSNIVDVESVERKRLCTGVAQKAICLKRDVKIKCKTYLKGRFCCDDIAPNDTYPNSQEFYSHDSNLGNNWQCDPNRCQELSTGTLNGYFYEREYDFWEHELVGVDRGALCNQKIAEEIDEQEDLTISFNGDNTVHLKNSNGTDDLDSRYFFIPSFTVTGNIGNYKVGFDSFEESIENCFGINTVEDTLCRKVNKGEAFNVNFFVVDSYGRKSNTLQFSVPANRKRYLRKFKAVTYYSTNGFYTYGVGFTSLSTEGFYNVYSDSCSSTISINYSKGISYQDFKNPNNNNASLGSEWAPTIHFDVSKCHEYNARPEVANDYWTQAFCSERHSLTFSPSGGDYVPGFGFPINVGQFPTNNYGLPYSQYAPVFITQESCVEDGYF
ncbi:MAG: hypothetical protein GY909_15905 [Oligoflexia bacterium]|nr:hypothetical protein [Oligoflexia bacterium]